MTTYYTDDEPNRDRPIADPTEHEQRRSSERIENEQLENDPGIGAGVGAGVGALGGVAAGAAIGSTAGPVGTIVGALVGAVAGSAAGTAVGGMVDPESENQYWRQTFHKEPYARNRPYEELEPAYRTGFEGYDMFEPGTKFEEAEPTLREDFEQRLRGDWRKKFGKAKTPREPSEFQKTQTEAISAATPAEPFQILPPEHPMEATESARTTPQWEDVRPAAQAAWNRVERGEALRVPIGGGARPRGD